MSFSVLLSVYSKESPNFLNESLMSIYDNQSLKPSEIVLVKDGPLTFELEEVIEQWKCKLGDILIVLKLEENKGLACALNFGLRYCTNDLVARMDTDDISLPHRFEAQVSFMNSNPRTTASSGEVVEYDLTLLNKLGVRRLPLHNEDLVKFCRYRSPLSHPAVMFRKNKILSVGGYPNFANSQDWALWSLLISKGERIANIDRHLLNMRTDNSLFERRGAKYYWNELKIFRYQRRIGLTRRADFYANVISKGVLRLSPNFIKKVAYKKLRK
ncbi:glycosyltransferase [Vibrio splendidus]